MKDYTDIIIAPVITEKSAHQAEKNVYTFKVATSANKIEEQLSKLNNTSYSLILVAKYAKDLILEYTKNNASYNTNKAANFLNNIIEQQHKNIFVKNSFCV